MNISRHISNIIGWSSEKKIIVIESDDWGSTRFKDSSTRDYFFEKYPFLRNSPMNYYDGLESDSDLELLYDLLLNFKDHYGNHPIITAFVNPANPDYDKIKNSGFKDYFHIDFVETAMRYPNHNNLLKLYEKGIAERIFIPQFHGREHLHARRWMESLQTQNEALHDGFNHEFFSFSINKDHNIKYNLRSPHEIDSLSEDILIQNEINKSGLKLFHKIFNYTARVMVPANGPFNRLLEKVLKEEGIDFLGISKLQKEPIGNNKYQTKFHYIGKKSASGIRYITRNASFEPFKEQKDWVNFCMNEINTAFLWKKPAVISSHRVNYVSLLDVKNRDRGLRCLSNLLRSILIKWPDVTFLSSEELGKLF